MQMMAPFVAGLGLFFCGVHFLSVNLTPLAGRRFRLALIRLLRQTWLSAFTGILAGIVTQSSHAVTYVVIGLVSGGVVDKRRAILIPTWAHVGTSILVILVALNLGIAASYVVALMGFAIYFGLDRTDRARHAIGALLGMGFLFLGLDALKVGSVPVRDLLMGEGLIATLAGHPLLLLLAGFGATIVCQSSAVVGAITVAASSVGLFELSGAVWLVLGSNLGSGLNNLILARTLRGEASQIALFQTVQKIAGFVILLAIIAADEISSRAFLADGASLFARGASGQIAAIFLFYQIAGSLFCSIFLTRIISMLEWLSPPSQLQELSKPAYLIDEALVDPTLAIELVGREERRLLARLPGMLDGVRAEGDANGPSANAVRQASTAITRAMTTYTEHIAEANLDRADRERVVRVQHRTANLDALADSIAEFVASAQAAREWPSSARVAGQMTEALHTLLTALAEAAESEDLADREFLLSLLGHRDELMERMRRRVLNEDPNLPPKAQEALFSTTMLFERIVWLARRSALLLTPAPVIAPAGAQVEAAA